jgi:hypothetical protein
MPSAAVLQNIQRTRDARAKAAQEAANVRAANLASQHKQEELTLEGDITGRLSREDFERRAGFARGQIGDLQKQIAALMGPSGTGGGELGFELTPAEQLAIEATEEAGEADINRLMDAMSDIGVLSSGATTTGVGAILGQTKAGTVGTMLRAQEGRLTRKHQRLLALQQQISDIRNTVLG